MTGPARRDGASGAARRRVTTGLGQVEGELSSGVWAFRGIPYARPPVGPLRWRPPQPARPWRGALEAHRSGPAAPQNSGVLTRFIADSGERRSEDCLTLNVWTPAPDTARRPVLVWIHGGGFNLGSGAHGVYDGSALARRGDCVVVTLNYRLGALGWLAEPAFEAEEGGVLGNLGLLDQVAALRWVAEQIEAFGGDASRVTLFGGSAGAMSIATLLATPAARGLFHRAILQSGAARNVHSREDALRIGQLFQRELGLTPGDVDALRATPVEALLAAQQRCVERVSGLPFQPCVDGSVLPRLPLEAIRCGEAAELPVLLGTNLDEWRLFGLSDPKAASLDGEGLLRRLSRSLGCRERAAHVIQVYTEARRDGVGVAPADLWFAIESDRWFRAPAAELAAALNGGRTYAYLFTWPSPALGGSLGACHALEVPFVFGTTRRQPLPMIVGEGLAVEALSLQLQDSWLRFARAGSPAEAAAWPAYDAERRATRWLGADEGLIEAPFEAERAVWDGLWDDLEVAARRAGDHPSVVVRAQARAAAPA